MSRKYNNNLSVTGVTRFSQAAMADVEFSKMIANPHWYLPFNGGDIVPCYYAEVLPHSTISLGLDFVIRQTTSLVPVMGDLQLDIFAFFVPNRIINESWKNVMGENTSGFWSAPEVNLSPLYVMDGLAPQSVEVNKGSIMDYYGFPTQAPIPGEVLALCNDLKFRGYYEIYNTFFRDQNFQPPLPFSKLNIYNSFILGASHGTTSLTADGGLDLSKASADGSFGAGAVVKSIAGDGGRFTNDSRLFGVLQGRSATINGYLLKANKLHDAFTSVLPSPQKGQEVFLSLSNGDIPVRTVDGQFIDTKPKYPLTFQSISGADNLTAFHDTLGLAANYSNRSKAAISYTTNAPEKPDSVGVAPINLVVDLSNATGVSISDLRTAISVQQVYETLARGGSRYTEILNSFFGIATENPFDDKPTQLGHIRRNLDLFQVAQTSASVAGGSVQGNLTAFGYTNNGGHLFTRTFLEHGYVHVFAIVRHRNVYSTYLAPDNFRLNTLDFYNPHLANISEQPIPLKVLNPFVSGEGYSDKVLGYQEAWWEYRYEPDRVLGDFRTSNDVSLSQWTYADDFDPDFTFVDGDWLKSNTEEVLNRSLAVGSDVAPQFMGYFSWKVEKELPMPTYSIPGLDTI